MAMDGFYLLLDSGNAPLAKGKMMSAPGSKMIQMRVLDDKIDKVLAHEVIQLVSMGAGEVPLQTHLVRHRDDMIILERMGTLNPEIRRSLRIPVRFDTFLYPASPLCRWQGRRPVRSIDLSCGGVAFYGSWGLRVGDKMEIIIPITTQPIIMRIQILRVQALKNDRTYYASKFIDMCRDEEDMICEAVFGIQLENRDQQAELEEEMEELKQ